MVKKSQPKISSMLYGTEDTVQNCKVDNPRLAMNPLEDQWNVGFSKLQLMVYH